MLRALSPFLPSRLFQPSVYSFVPVSSHGTGWGRPVIYLVNSSGKQSALSKHASRKARDAEWSTEKEMRRFLPDELLQRAVALCTVSFFHPMFCFFASFPLLILFTVVLAHFLRLKLGNLLERNYHCF